MCSAVVWQRLVKCQLGQLCWYFFQLFYILTDFFPTCSTSYISREECCEIFAYNVELSITCIFTCFCFMVFETLIFGWCVNIRLLCTLCLYHCIMLFLLMLIFFTLKHTDINVLLFKLPLKWVIFSSLLFLTNLCLYI